jgi:hypothetical protein
MSKDNLKTATIVLLAVALGSLLTSRGVLAPARAQVVDRTGGVILVVGEQYSADAPVVILDVPNQTVMVYEYSYQNNRIEFTAARTYKYDRLLTDWNTRGPTVEEVRQQVTR